MFMYYVPARVFFFFNCTTMKFNFLQCTILLIFVFATSSTCVYSFPNNVTDHQALLSFKDSIRTDPFGVLDSWNHSIHFCQWNGITCSRRRQRVIALELSSLQLVGTLSSQIGNLSFLRLIHLRNNSFHGSIPNEIGRLFRLQYLSLTYNSFEGRFPTNMSHCVDIRNISMFGNKLKGDLPTEFASWSKLGVLNLGSNYFTGSILPSIGNLSSVYALVLDSNNLKGGIPNEFGRLVRLQYLYLGHNFLQGGFPANLSHCVDMKYIDMPDNHLEGELPSDLAPWSKLYHLDLGSNAFVGSIPPSIGNISLLRFLDLRRNNLTGSIPLEVAHLAKLEYFVLFTNSFFGRVPIPLYNISSLNAVDLTDNEFEGMLPADLGFTLPKLQEFHMGLNRFSGPVPPSVANASNLVTFAIPRNNMTGPIPINWGNLLSLQELSLNNNPLGVNQRPGDLSFFNSLGNCTRLKKLHLNENGLRGELPKSIVNLSTTIEELALAGNNIYGSIPHEIVKFLNMRILSVGSNSLTGSIPESIGELSKLGGLDLSYNKVSGVIPNSISNLTQLVGLYLPFNALEGSIPTGFFNISSLQKLYLNNNRLGGEIPKEIVGFSSQCFILYLAENLFTGPLPSNIGSLKHLVELDVSHNKLKGAIPFSLGNCVMLEELYMEENNFKGRIPDSFKALRSLRILDLSSNNISENIPRFFDDFHFVEFLNLSHNKLEGEVPREGLFADARNFSVVGNLQLCGGIQALHLPPCLVKVSRNKNKTYALRIILLVVLVPLGILFACLVFICYRRQNIKHMNDPVPLLQDNQHLKLSYQDLLQATNEFSPNNFLGKGRYGTVYKGVPESVKHIVAVKVFNVGVRGANKSFLTECETLRNIRHRNLIKIITACSSTDFKGNDFKALVFEFMANGSVDNWLHPSPFSQGNERNLTLLQRLNIAIDVAQGIDYLHHHSHASIVHSDIKPSNILLDEDFVAHIGDFGLARFSFATSDVNLAEMSSTGVRGTIGYVPPEYGIGAEISTEGDVYSYGILILEMFSGKQPTECSMVIDGGSSNLHDYVRKALPHRVLDIADPRILLDHEEHSLTVNQSYRRATMEACLASIFEVGIFCSEETPSKRIDISVAMKQLRLAREKLLQRRQ